MKKYFHGLKLTIIMALSVTSINACDFCGAFLGITPFDNQSSISLSHRYRVFNGYTAMQQSSGFFPAGAYRLPAGYSPSPLHGTAGDSMNMSASDFESYKVVELRGRWFIHPRVELNAFLPFVSNKSKTDDETFRIAGMGDCSFFAAWHVLQHTDIEKMRYRLIAGLGVKFPTGACDVTYADGDRAPLMLQPGTGSTDGFCYLAFTSATGNWRWGINSIAKFNGANKYGERVSPSTVNTGFLAYQLSTCGLTVLPQLQVYEEYTRGVWDNSILLDGTGMNMILAGAGVELYRNRFGVSLGAQLPVYQQTDEMNMKTAGRLMIGISYSFQQEKFLVN